MLPQSEKTKPLEPTLYASVRDAMWFSVMLGAGESYFGALGVYLGGSPYQIGVLATLPLLLGALSQRVGVSLMKSNKSRKNLLVFMARLQAFVWLPLALLTLFNGGHIVNILIVLVCLYFILGNIAAPVWNSLLGDLVPVAGRGEFFGLRNRKSGYLVVASLVVAGLVLEVFQRFDLAAIAFFVLFLLSGFARFRSSSWLDRHEDPAFIIENKDHFSFLDFLHNSPRSNFARFVFYFAAVNFSVFLAGPYFILYMLNDLNWSFGQFMLAIACQLIVQFGAMQNWGLVCDQFGNKKVLSVCGIGVAIIPFFWLFHSNFYYLLIVQAYSGLVWAGFNLSAFNFLFDAVTSPKRARCTAYMNMINGVFVFLGAVAGAWLLGFFHSASSPWFEQNGVESIFLHLFLLSGVLRIVSVFLLERTFLEVREVSGVSHSEILYRVANVRAWSGFRFEVLSGVGRSSRADKGGTDTSAGDKKQRGED